MYLCGILCGKAIEPKGRMEGGKKEEGIQRMKKEERKEKMNKYFISIFQAAP